MIIGGLGGIGRATALWMIGKGAKNKLITLRWGDSVPDARQLRETAQAAGSNLEIRNYGISDGHSLM